MMATVVYNVFIMSVLSFLASYFLGLLFYFLSKFYQTPWVNDDKDRAFITINNLAKPIQNCTSNSTSLMSATTDTFKVVTMTYYM